MTIDHWIVIGAGGHARVVMDALLCKLVDANSLAFADDDAALHGRVMLGRPVLGAVSDVARPGTRFHVAVGGNSTRKMLYERMMDANGIPFSVTHPAACISPHATLNEASFIAAGAVIAPAVSIGIGAIVNHCAVVDHDCRVGDFSHIAPCVTLAGGVTVGRRVLIGAGANVLPGVTIGDDAVIGAGAVVTVDVPPEVTLVGIPARILNRVK